MIATCCTKQCLTHLTYTFRISHHAIYQVPCTRYPYIFCSRNPPSFFPYGFIRSSSFLHALSENENPSAPFIPSLPARGYPHLPCPLGLVLSSRSSRLKVGTTPRGFTAAAAATTTRPPLRIPSLAPCRVQHRSRFASTTRNENGNASAAAPSAEYTASGPAAKSMLYGSHLPTSPFQRAAMAGWAAVTALGNPERADMVATLGEVTGRLALERLYR